MTTKEQRAIEKGLWNTIRTITFFTRSCEVNQLLNEVKRFLKWSLWTLHLTITWLLTLYITCLLNTFYYKREYYFEVVKNIITQNLLLKKNNSRFVLKAESSRCWTNRHKDSLVIIHISLLRCFTLLIFHLSKSINNYNSS